MLKQYLKTGERAFATSVSAADHQFSRMEALYQGYFSAENQRKIICIGRNYRAHI